MLGEGITARHEIIPRQHTERLLDMVEELLSEGGLQLQDLDGLAFGRGPGSFTGVRIATSVIQGFALGANLQVACVSTLLALAHGAWRETQAGKIITAFDARMGEVYYAAYAFDAQGQVTITVDERVCPPDEAPVPDSGHWTGIGDGWSVYESTLRARLDACLDSIDAKRLPHAHDVAVLGRQLFIRGETVDAAHALPVYLRDQVVKKPAC